MVREESEGIAAPGIATDPVSIARSLLEAARAVVGREARIPLCTYRLQFNQKFRFEDAKGLAPYLERLGVSHIYASPYFKAGPGSTHGYDVVDHNVLNPEVGTPEEYEDFCAALAARGLGQVLDFVPNHMGIERDNAKWDDVLENGPSSMFARYFDIDWDPVKEELKGKVLLPVLGDQYGIVLDRGELQISFAAGAFWLHYYDRSFAIAPRQYAALLSHRLGELRRELGSNHPHLVELESILTAIGHLPRRGETDPAKLIERNREKEVIKRRLGTLAADSKPISDFIQRNVKIFNGVPGEPRSFDRLDAVLGQCSYRAAHWRVAGEEINYRRFFDINGLAAIRVEDRQVFDGVHALVFRLISEGKVQGLRIDHPDGLFDPTAYFLDLQERYWVDRTHQQFARVGYPLELWPKVEKEVRRFFRAEVAEHPDSPLTRGLYVVAEKIQGGRERVPEAWAIAGNTGYRFANVTGGLFVNPESKRSLTETYAQFIGRDQDFRELVYEKKKLIMDSSMASEINVLARELNQISEMNRRTRDFTLNSLRRALVEFIALFPVYRSYVDGSREVDQRDIQYIEWTIGRAKEKDPTTNVSIFDFLQAVLLRRHPDHLRSEERDVMLRCAMRVQQVTGPVMAKAVEDTVFYIYNRLVSLNEVGGEPERFGSSLDTFHLRNQERAERWSGSLCATSTHDTKRSEDVRARLNVISEVPEEWRASVRQWARLNRRFKKSPTAPEANDEYLFYQSVVGAWPMGQSLSTSELQSFRERLEQYMLKAIREAKVNTSWVNPNPDYESAMAEFVRAALSQGNSEFVQQAERFVRRIERPGQLNSLAQVLIKIGSPGVTDVYQGCELWDLSLVDPDNRRPVDFSLRRRMLESLDREAEADRLGLCKRLFEDMSDGRIKLFVVSQGLRFARRHPALFRAEYLPLSGSGPGEGHLICFMRRMGDSVAIVIAPRLVTRLLDQGGLSAQLRDTYVQLPTELRGVSLKNVFTGETLILNERNGSVDLSAGEALESFPLALLERTGE
jgi:(1->4)-alpha-D-glucan 1-alpha-D-glucosylmutase